MLAIGYVAICVLLFIFQRKLIYFPVEDSGAAPGASAFSELEDHTLRGWVLNPAAKNAILYYGGNGEAIEGNLSSFQNLWPNHAIFLFAYRGYGGSEGSPSEEGLYEDALAIFDKANEKFDKVSLVGRSLGSGVATYVAANRKAHKLILITPFDSITAIAQQQYPILPVKYLLLDRYDSLGRVPEIDEKTLIVMAEKDQIVPRKNSDRLASAFKKEQLEVVIVPGAGHNDISYYKPFHAALKAFL
ncbi:MAG: alpha/beta hydrolase [Planctomycetes bacterium]|nr:alpha/beta hydrolase [Planctomycetota bacterium]MCP4771510.1 alpha/beta hydrolase [Planctomycetota bacterium]MCP4861171.1 alpha/beta hydrolase [Planctomycetota bacterium]